MDAAAIVDTLRSRYPRAIEEASVDRGIATVRATREGLKTLARGLRSDADLAFEGLFDLFAIDYLHWEEKALRFEVVYSLYSYSKNHRLFVKVAVPEDDAALPSVADVWGSADWFERETWDMMGIRFDGHPNLKRILMYEGFQGHALRKDYRYNQRQPLIGPMN